MGGQVERLGAFGQRKTMANEAFKVHLARLHPVTHDKADRLFLQVDRGAIGTDQSFFVDANGCRIDNGLSVLRLSKQQNPTTGTGRIHRGANQSVAADGQDNGIGAASIGQRTDAFHHIRLRSINCML